MEMAKIVHLALHHLEQSTDSLAALLELPWKVPSHVLGLSSPRSRRRLLETARLPDKSYKGKAAHVKQLLPMVPCLLELLDEDNQLAMPLASFEALLKIHLELSNLKRQEAVSDTTRLQQLQREHHGLCLAAYGEEIMKPKHHWRHHAAKQIEAWGAYIDTSASEAQHQVYKGVANKNLDAHVSSPSWSKAVLDRMFCSCFEQLQTLRQPCPDMQRKGTEGHVGPTDPSGPSERSNGMVCAGSQATSSLNLFQAWSRAAV